VAEVKGEIEEGYDRADLLAATFPGGSITGAPKIRAMEIIDELEAGRRGPYTGAIGLLSDDGNMDLNIAIRTPVLARGEIRVHVGGGIVADSVPEAEYDETLAKGKAIFEALGGAGA
jgi:anthranilate/para-aminobenzoate synthase component I